ncbi:SEC-C domain-containing protein, partial [Candidatus Woesebacteria bacterium]|nr:SEC-C domain-containing protein [Candidatus Woesebacteria bacterium]
ISRAIEQAQIKVEGFNFDIRKRLVEFDDVANQQRDIIYKLRRRILESKDVKEEVLEKLEHQIERILVGEGEMDFEMILGRIMEIIPFDETSAKSLRAQIEKLPGRDTAKEFLSKVIRDVHATREKQVGETTMRQIEKYAYLGSIDHLWMDHIDHIDDLREGVTLRAYGQRDPLVEFKNEAYNLFETLIDRIDEELSRRIFRIGVAQPKPEIPLEAAKENIDVTDMTGLVGGADEAAASGPPAFPDKGPGRNDPCPCGSGKKWKKCGLLNTEEHQKLMAGK